MKMPEIRELARTLGVRVAGMTKTEAVRAIQLAEGNFDCFGRASSGYCDQIACLYREDCMAESTRREKSRNRQQES